MKKKQNANNIIPPAQDEMRLSFKKYEKSRRLIVNELKEKIEQILVSINSNPVVSGRHKNFSSYYNKYIKFLKAGEENPKINDLLGIRIICPFIEDLEEAEKQIGKNFDIQETERKEHVDFKDFCYESTHLLIKIPDEYIKKHGNPGTDIVEIQIKTILQDAWAEVEHELVYKAEFSPFDEPMKRKLAAVNANLTLADIIFQEIRSHQRKYTREIEKRRESFYKKIEESTNEFLFKDEKENKETVQINADYLIAGNSDNLHIENIPIDNTSTDSDSVDNVFINKSSVNNASIDDLLVEALTAHNKSYFSQAIDLYSMILDLKPSNQILSIIHKHRGMAYFACSKYKEAVADFTKTLDLDDKSYKAAYYRGVVRSVLKEYLQAIDDYTLSLKINPYQPFCLFRRGQAYFHIDDYPQALSDCEDSISLEPKNVMALKFRQLLKEKLKM